MEPVIYRYIYIYITLVWLFESLDEVRVNNFRPLTKFSGYVSVPKSPDFDFYDRPTAGSVLPTCNPVVRTRENPKIEILKMTVWFVLEV